jgi:hypothetical protein
LQRASSPPTSRRSRPTAPTPGWTFCARERPTRARTPDRWL